MTCPGCRRANQPHRRYCGSCGINLEPVCQRCDFANESADHFCGGCGHALRADDDAPAMVRSTRPAPTSPPPTRPAPISPPRLAIVSAIDTISQAELAELLAPVITEAVALPQGSIDQDDLDRLFGATP